MKRGQITKAISYVSSEIRYGKEPMDRRPSTRPPAITLSRQTGTRGLIIGEKLVEYLKRNDPHSPRPWTLFDKDLIAKVLEDHHLPTHMVRYMPEKKVSEITSVIEEILGLHPSSWTLAQETMETILRLAELGNAIIYGRGGNIITAHLKNVVNVRLVGSMERRIAQTAEQNNVSLKEAKSLVVKDDRGRSQYIRSHFAKDIDDPLLYDVVINTDALSDQIIVKTIGDLALSLGKYHRKPN